VQPSDGGPDPVEAGWRFAAPADEPFLYDLAVTIDPRWWRITRAGTAPPAVVGALRQSGAVAVVTDGAGTPVGAAALCEHTPASATAVLEVHALPGQEDRVRRVAAALVRAAVEGGGLRRLYYRDFDDDPDVLGDVRAWFTPEVRLPRFARVDGEYRDRTEWCLVAAEMPPEPEA